MDWILNLSSVSFFIGISCVAYTYVLYPIVIWGLSRVFGANEKRAISADDHSLPNVSLLISAHNEAAVIAERIENALAMDYPSDKLEILIASDGSTDETADLVRHYASRGVRLLDYAVRRGKSSTLNVTMGEVRSEIVVLSDANTHFDTGAVRSLVKWFADPQVGAVCGRLILVDPESGKNVDGMYWKYETLIKKQEGRLGALLGSNGAIYAIRRSVFQPIPDNTIVDDFVIPLLAKLRTGCRIVYDCDAVAREETAPDAGSEFRRRCRIGAGGFQAIALLWPLLNPAHGWTALTFFSHKILRWFCPFAMLLALVTNLLLIGVPFYRWMLAIQAFFYIAAALGTFANRSTPLARILRLCSMFVSMNAALFIGFIRWSRGVRSGTWRPTPRVAAAAAPSGTA